MCDCCLNDGFWDPLFDLSNWIPVVVAVIAYYLQRWMMMVRIRKEESNLAVMYLKEIRMEIETGLERLLYLYEHGGRPFQIDEYKPLMPIANWNGVRDILPDNVNNRILNVLRADGQSGECANLRHHLKNYYTVICKFGNDVIKGEQKFCKQAAREDIDGTRMILRLIDKIDSAMRRNAKSLIWPY